MPFEEIGKTVNWVTISSKRDNITICKSLRDKFTQEKVRLYYDSSANLFGIEPSPILGYKVGETGRVRCRRLPVEGKFEAEWDEDRKMIIVDLTKDL